MAESSVKLVRQLSGTVQVVHMVVGVATDDYGVLKNKPRLNGVELSGNVTLEQLGVQDCLSVEARSLLIAILRRALYRDDQSVNITALAQALEVTEPAVEKTLTGIEADYSGGSVSAGTKVDALTGISVRALYSDGSRALVTGYTLSGTIKPGENTVTVTYEGFTDTFTVTGTQTTMTIYTVTNRLTKVTSSNDVVSVPKGYAYTAVLTPYEGYEIGTVTVTMGGTDITQSVYSDGLITIPSITGSVVITAAGVEIPTEGGDSGSVVNLFDKDTMVTQGYFINTSGVTAALAGAKYAAVPVTGGKTYAMQKQTGASNSDWNSGAAGAIGFYDSAMNQVSILSIPVATFTESSSGLGWSVDKAFKGICVEVPEGVSYILLTLKLGTNGVDFTDTFMVEEGDTCHDYVAYV